MKGTLYLMELNKDDFYIVLSIDDKLKEKAIKKLKKVNEIQIEFKEV